MKWWGAEVRSGAVRLMYSVLHPRGVFVRRAVMGYLVSAQRWFSIFVILTQTHRHTEHTSALSDNIFRLVFLATDIYTLHFREFVMDERMPCIFFC